MVEMTVREREGCTACSLTLGETRMTAELPCEPGLAVPDKSADRGWMTASWFSDCPVRLGFVDSLSIRVHVQGLQGMSHRFRLEGAVSRPAGRINDDAFDALDRIAWVLDGATGISPVRLLPGQSDASWFCGTLRKYLREAAGMAGSNRIVLEQALATTSTSFERFKKREEKDRAELPAASCAMAAIRDDHIEISVIGDCTVFLDDGHGGIEKISDQRVRQYDDAVVDGIVQLMKRENAPCADALERARATIWRNREIRNRDTTYWVLDPNVGSLRGVMTSTHDLFRTKRLVMMTDGFYRLVDTYGAYTDDGLLEAVVKRGCHALCSELREIEGGDSECRRYVRIKARDDASCVVLSVE